MAQEARLREAAASLEVPFNWALECHTLILFFMKYKFIFFSPWLLKSPVKEFSLSYHNKETYLFVIGRVPLSRAAKMQEAQAFYKDIPTLLGLIIRGFIWDVRILAFVYVPFWGGLLRDFSKGLNF